MSTPGEKKALFFISVVAVLGSAARLVSARAVPVPTASELAALDGQIRAVDSVRREGKRKGKSGKARGVKSRADTGSQSGRSTATAPGGLLPPSFLPPRSSLLDVDLASIAQLESLPGIGPALARRIVAVRDSSGPFGGMDVLQSRVRGVGPALARRLAPAVTFSGPRSPPSAERTEPFGKGGTTARRKRGRRL